MREHANNAIAAKIMAIVSFRIGQRATDREAASGIECRPARRSPQRARL
jgi:hypothetical protein